MSSRNTDRAARTFEHERRICAELARVPRPCGGRMQNGPGKRFAYCCKCRRVDYEANEGDRCKREAGVSA